MSHRFDNRDKETFKKDILFGTKLEKYLFNKWLKVCEPLEYIKLSSPRDNGVCNEGTFIEKGKTSGADYLINISYNSFTRVNLPIEVKWVPTPGKFSLKSGDLKGYIRDRAAILFIYNTNPRVNLKKRKDYDYETHVRNISNNDKYIRWGIMLPDSIDLLYNYYDTNNLIKPIYYMGNKPGIVLQEREYHLWFKEEKWSYEN